jgi:hypothetical protein
MKRAIVRYKVRADQAAVNEAYIRQVFEQLEATRPPGLHYASFKLDDDVSFIHIVSYEAGEGSNPLTVLPAFKAFTAAIASRCVEPPVVSSLNEVGVYRVFGD